MNGSQRSASWKWRVGCCLYAWIRCGCFPASLYYIYSIFPWWVSFIILFLVRVQINIFSKNNNNKNQICICFHIILAVQNTRKMATVKKRKPGDGLSICYNDVRLIHLKKYFPLWHIKKKGCFSSATLHRKFFLTKFH